MRLRTAIHPVINSKFWEGEEESIAKQLTMLLHDLEELDDDLGGRSDQDLSLTSLLGVGDGLESVSENRRSGH